MHVAFSRKPGQDKKYVQHHLVDDAPQIRELILRTGANVYVCGNAGRMAKDVFATMTRLLSEDSLVNGDMEDAVGYLNRMKVDKRWLEDVW